MNSFLLLKDLIENLNQRFISGSIPTRIYDEDRVLNSVSVKAPNKFIGIINRNQKECDVLCFDWFLMQNKLVTWELNRFKKELQNRLNLKIKINLKFDHVVNQRRLKKEALDNGKLVFGKTW